MALAQGQTWNTTDGFGDIGLGTVVTIEMVADAPEPGLGGDPDKPIVVFTWIDGSANARRSSWDQDLFLQYFTEVI